MKREKIVRNLAFANRSLLWLVAAAIVACVCIASARAKHDTLYPEYDAFTRIVEEVMEKYVDKVDRKKLFYGAYQGMLRSLDEYSQYISPEQLAEFNVNTRGEFGGLGIEIGIRNGILTVITPLRGTPAYEAGIMPNDRIAVKKLRGKPGTKVTITILRQGAKGPIEITITRAVIRVPSVEWKMVDDEAKIGYVQLVSFQEHSAERMKKAIEELKARGMKRLILDLRNNPGGLLSSAVDVADAFLSGGEIVKTIGRDKTQSVPYTATPRTEGDFDMAVLINKGSASASEIVAGALKDHNRAVLVGTNTFGKGSVQSVIPITIGADKAERGALKLTTARYYTPKSNESIDKKGIKPDIEVDLSLDAQLLLREIHRLEHIQNQSGKKGSEKNQEEVEQEILEKLRQFQKGELDREAVSKRITELAKEGKLTPQMFTKAEKLLDVQLQRAIDALKMMDVLKRVVRTK